MSDIAFIGSAYLLALGVLGAYAVALLRRLRSANAIRAAAQRRANGDTARAVAEPNED